LPPARSTAQQILYLKRYDAHGGNVHVFLMKPLELPSGGGSLATAEVSEEHYRLRSYQAEMVEESLRSNIVCVMDTGSGKTHM
jgi:superfamily II DNA or RNA helicase